MRLLAWVPAAAVAVVQAIWALRLPDRFADLHVYRGAVLAVRHGESLYSYAAPNGDPFTYPPFAGLVLPGDSVRYWFTELWRTDRIGNLALSGNQSLNGLLLRLGVSSRAVWLGVAVLVLVVGLWRASRSRDPLTGIVIVGAVGVAVSPVSWTHHQIWLVFAAFCAVRRWQPAWTATVLVVMTVPALVNLRAPLAVAIACVVPFGPGPGSVRRLEDAEADRRGG